MHKFLVEVEEVRGHCTRGYKKGDRFTFNGFDTPDAFCGGAYTILFPILVTFRSGGSFKYEKNPFCKTNMACPDGGNVLFRVSPLQETGQQ
jgi:uncharacterized repeat protein (TIGR04076 family)